MPRLAPIALLAAALALSLAPGASAQDLAFAHDPAVETSSGFYPGDPAAGDALAARLEGTYETFPLAVPEGTRHGSLTASIAWTSPGVNLDLAVYRLGPSGVVVSPAVARSASSGRASEGAVYAPVGRAVEPGRYLVVVDNYCSRDADDDPRTPAQDTADCGIDPEVPDEDGFRGSVRLGNQLPAVTLAGPDSGYAGQPLAFTAIADDLDGSISGYWFDLDGDGIYEQDSDGIPEAEATFATPGTYTVAVQVLDDAGAIALASRRVTVTRAPRARRSAREPLWSFRLNARTFGGPLARRLVVSYRLRERARVSVVLRRGSRRVRLIGAGVRRARRTHRIVLKPARLRRGVYTVQIAVQGASGTRQTAELRSRRR